MHTKTYIERSVKEAADSMKDIAVFLGELTDNESASLDDVKKAACAFKETAEGLCHAINANERVNGTLDTSFMAVLHGEKSTGYDRAYGLAKAHLDTIPASWTPHLNVQGGLDAIIDMQDKHLKEMIANGNYTQRIEAYKMLAAASLYALERMTCDK